jgi:predicted AAA+ superfamily ATPase
VPFTATRRDAVLPEVPNKVHSVIGMRRAGKTTFLRQLQADWRAQVPAHRVVYLNFDDDRLKDLPLDQLNKLLEAYYRLYPDLRGAETVYWLLDEIHAVAEWERFARRLHDTENIQLVVSGSSARLLSREVHTSLRGRGVETIIHPFSFREYLRHHGDEPDAGQSLVGGERSRIEKRFLEYLDVGGFPEAQDLSARRRVELLQGYVDVVLFRDVVERYQISQVGGLRWLTRHCLRNPAGTFSVHAFHRDLESQGQGVRKNTVYEMLAHLTDAFLITLVPVASESEKRQQVNPRKVYPADPGLIRAFDVSGRSNVGHALETVVLHEINRRGWHASYVKTRDGFEVDFLARRYDGRQELIQVCADPSAPAAQEREVRGLIAAHKEHRRAVRRLLVLTADQLTDVAADGVVVQTAYEWLLEGDQAT